jgi:hypothetical protein
MRPIAFCPFSPVTVLVTKAPLENALRIAIEDANYLRCHKVFLLKENGPLHTFLTSKYLPSSPESVKPSCIYPLLLSFSIQILGSKDISSRLADFDKN